MEDFRCVPKSFILLANGGGGTGCWHNDRDARNVLSGATRMGCAGDDSRIAVQLLFVSLYSGGVSGCGDADVPTGFVAEVARETERGGTDGVHELLNANDYLHDVFLRARAGAFRLSGTMGAVAVRDWSLGFADRVVRHVAAAV